MVGSHPHSPRGLPTTTTPFTAPAGRPFRCRPYLFLNFQCAFCSHGKQDFLQSMTGESLLYRSGKWTERIPQSLLPLADSSCDAGEQTQSLEYARKALYPRATPLASRIFKPTAVFRMVPHIHWTKAVLFQDDLLGFWFQICTSDSEQQNYT